MSKATKTLLVIFGSVAGVALLMVVATWVWWNFNETDIKAMAQAAANAGYTVGQGTDESGCVNTAFERFKTTTTKRDANSAMRDSMWVAGCLESAKPSDKFCVGMPVADSPVAIHTWATTVCAQRGIVDPYCPPVIGLVPRHCVSENRAQKLKAETAKPPG